MDASNLMADVAKLRCDICRDFLRLILKEWWTRALFDKADDAIENHKRHASMYTGAWEYLRNNGVRSYTVDMMDADFIIEVVTSGFKGAREISEETRDALLELKDDRGITNRSSEGEEPEELYLRGLMVLCDLGDFVRAVDKYETGIDDEERVSYRLKYIPRIIGLKNLLDGERARIVQRRKGMLEDIERILDSDDSLSEWSKVCKRRIDHYDGPGNAVEAYDEFMTLASDAGIAYAHVPAAGIFLADRDYEECERRLFMSFYGFEELPSGVAFRIVRCINCCIEAGYDATDGMLQLIQGIADKGYPVALAEDGFYKWHI